MEFNYAEHRADQRAEARQDEMVQAEIAMQKDFMKSALACNVGAIADWAPYTADFTKPLGQLGIRSMRPNTVSEVLEDSLHLGHGPKFSDVFAFLCKSAKDGNKEAFDLLSRLSEQYASFNAVGDDE